MKLSEVLPHLIRTYKSVKFDIACAYHEGKWCNVLTIVQFTIEEHDKANHLVLQDPIFQKVATNQQFRLFRKYFPLSSLSTLLEKFNECTKTIEGTIIEYGHSVHLENFDLHYYSYSPISIDKEWGTFQTYSSGQNALIKQKLVEHFDSYKADVIECGEDVFDAIKNMFHYDMRGNPSVDIVLVLPLFAKIEKMELQRGKIKFISRYHKNLTDLVLQYKREGKGSPTLKTYRPSDGRTNDEGEFRVWEVETGDTVTDPSNANDICNGILVLAPLSTSIDVRKKVAALLAENKLLDFNPLATIFSKFCKVEKLEDMLIKPIQVKMSGFVLDDKFNFERAVQWLFTLHGFNAIWLGQDFQTIKGDSGRNEGSADVLCYSEVKKTLVFISCKTGVPDSRDIDLIKNLAGKFKSKFQELNVQVIPIIVSSVYCDSVRQNANQVGVRILDANDLKKILEKIYEGPPQPNLLLKEPLSNPLYDTLGILS